MSEDLQRQDEEDKSKRIYYSASSCLSDCVALGRAGRTYSPCHFVGETTGAGSCCYVTVEHAHAPHSSWMHVSKEVIVF